MKTTIAIIGCGRIANGAHFPALANLIDKVRVKYACDLVLEKAVKAKEKYSFVENVTTDYHEVLADPEVKAVWVLTPNYAHYYVTMDALKAGKHVFCEKPITVNYKLSKEMADEAEKRGLILNIGVCNRFNKSVETLAQYCKEGKFGNIYHVNCVFRSFRSIPGLGGSFTTKSESGGGVLIDWGVHFLDLILYVLGGAKIKSATCDTYSEMAKDMKSYRYKSMWAADTVNLENGTNDVDDYVTGYVRTDKASISFDGAWAQNIDKDEKYIDFLGDKAGARLTYCGTFAFTDGATLETTVSDGNIPDMYTREDDAFIESVNTGVKNRGNIADVIETARLLQLLYDSAEIHKEIGN